MFIRFGLVLRQGEGGGGDAGGGGGGSSSVSSSGESGGSGAPAGGSSGAPASAAAFVGNGGGSSGAGGGTAGKEGAGGKEAAAGDGAAAKPASTKHKIKRDGQERELSTEELIALASDDYEEELTIDGVKGKYKRPDLLRGAQLGNAAFKRMQEAAELKKTYGSKLESLKGNLREFLEQHVEDGDGKEDRLEKVATEILKERYELNLLKKKDPDAYIRRIEERRTQRAAAQAEAKKAAEERTARTEAQRAKIQARIKALPAAFEAVGLKPSGLTGLALQRIYSEADAQGYDLPVEHAAGMVRDAVKHEMSTTLAALEGDALLSFLGDDVLKRVRAADVKRLHGKGADGKGEGEGESAGGLPPRPKAKEKKPPRSLEDFANPNQWLGD